MTLFGELLRFDHARGTLVTLAVFGVGAGLLQPGRDRSVATRLVGSREQKPDGLAVELA